MIEANRLHQDIGQYAFEKPIPGQSLTNSPDRKHTSELQSHHDLVCRLLLEKKKKKKTTKKKKKKKQYT